MGTPPTLSPYPPPLACLTGVKEPIVIQNALPPPIVCDSWKPSELIQTSAHSTAPPPPAALSFLLFISLSLSLAPSPFPPPHLYVLSSLFKLSHAPTQLDPCRHMQKPMKICQTIRHSLPLLLVTSKAF